MMMADEIESTSVHHCVNACLFKEYLEATKLFRQNHICEEKTNMFQRWHLQILLSIFFALLLVTTPVYAVGSAKVSSLGGGHQIWFEAEDYDVRDPDTDEFYLVIDADGAFGKAMTRAGGAGGMINWTFDISAAGGQGGTWYFWCRSINPNNQSDYMLVEGDPDDAEIPAGPPYPGESDTPPFSNDDDRIFEEDVPDWGWARASHEEGHTKELQDGVNTMYIYHRQGNDTVRWDVFMWTDSADYVPTDDDYNNAELLGAAAVRPLEKLSTTWGGIKNRL
jgi:hypothetical protein